MNKQDLDLLGRVRNIIDELQIVDIPSPQSAICDKIDCSHYAFFHKCYSDIYKFCAIYNDETKILRLPPE